MTTIPGGSRMPPWPVALVLLFWGWTVLGFGFFAVYWHSLSHWFMAALSLFLGVAVFFRWRVGFWMSVVGCAAGIGGTLARISAVDDPPRFLFASLAIGLGSLLVHQVLGFLKWFGFSNARAVRLGCWLFAAIVCVIAEFWLFRFLPKDR